MGAKQIIAAHTVHYGGISADLLGRILTASRLTATQLRSAPDAYQLNPERVSAAMAAQPGPAHTSSALAHYAALNGQSPGQGDSHVVH